MSPILKLVAVVCWIIAIPVGLLALSGLAFAGNFISALIYGSFALALLAMGARAWTHKRRPRR